jgi:hypothetical protein
VAGAPLEHLDEVDSGLLRGGAHGVGECLVARVRRGDLLWFQQELVTPAVGWVERRVADDDDACSGGDRPDAADVGDDVCLNAVGCGGVAQPVLHRPVDEHVPEEVVVVAAHAECHEVGVRGECVELWTLHELPVVVVLGFCQVAAAGGGAGGVGEFQAEIGGGEVRVVAGRARARCACDVVGDARGRGVGVAQRDVRRTRCQ